MQRGVATSVSYDQAAQEVSPARLGQVPRVFLYQTQAHVIKYTIMIALCWTEVVQPSVFFGSHVYFNNYIFLDNMIWCYIC